MKQRRVSLENINKANEVMMGKRERPCICGVKLPPPPTRAQLVTAGENAMKATMKGSSSELNK